jgi:hypothetical protein
MNVITKTTCGNHRIYGYSYDAQLNLVCKKCGLPDAQHETNAETLARKDREAKAGA